MSKWESEKEELNRLINTEKVSYEEIGRRYGCSGANIKKVAKQLGIELPQRRKINPNETFNKGTGKKYFCLNCGKELHQTSTSLHKFCDRKCQSEYNYKEFIKRWKNEEETGIRGASAISMYIKRYLFEKYNHKCEKCGWGEENPYSHTIPLEIHYIDGNCTNNKEENLQLLCPNCHSLTNNFRSLNKDSNRFRY